MKKILSIVIAAVIVVTGIIVLTSCSKNEVPEGSMVSYEQQLEAVPSAEFVVDGLKITFKETTLNDIAEAGWTVDGADVNEVISENGPCGAGATVSKGETAISVDILADENQTSGEAVVTGINIVGVTDSKPVDVQFEGKTITLGKTTVQNLLDDGWTTDMEILKKDDKGFGEGGCAGGDFTIAGKTIYLSADNVNSVESYADCIIDSIS